MIQPFAQFKRFVVPNWRPFETTLRLGELSNNSSKISIKSIPDTAYNKLVEDWRQNKDIGHAADLVSVSLINRVVNEDVFDAANYIIKHSYNASKSLFDLSVEITKANKVLTFNNKSDLIAQELKEFNSPNFIYDKIRHIRSHLKVDPKDAVQWVELSRLYSIIGQANKAIDAMKIALNLNPQNRFIVRSATRLFVHNKEFDFIHDILRKHDATKYDPWFAAAEISTASLRGRNSSIIKYAHQMIKSNNFSNFSLTELASSVGTVELLSGTIKKAKEYFIKSMLEPNDNSYAQLHWALSKDNDLNLSQPDLMLSYSYEANAIKDYEGLKWNSVIENSIKWFLDMPYSRRPLLMGSYVASIFTNELDKAIEMCKVGLISHPGDAGLINNLAYALALKGEVDEATIQLSKVTVADSSEESFLLATTGLVAFRKNDVENGRYLYREAIGELSKLNDKYYAKLAFLNFLREEIRIANDLDTAHSLYKHLDEINFDPRQSDLLVIKNSIINQFKHKNYDMN